MKQLLLFLVGLLTLSFNTIGQAFDTVISKDEAIQSFFSLSAWLLGIVFLIVAAIYSSSIKRQKEDKQVISPLEDKEPVNKPDNEEISAFDLSTQQETATNDLVLPIQEEPLPIVEPAVDEADSIPSNTLRYLLKPIDNDLPEVEEAESIPSSVSFAAMSSVPEINDDATVSVETPIEPEVSEEIASIVAEPTIQPEPKKKLVRKKKGKASSK
jgi:hypothetical protein